MIYDKFLCEETDVLHKVFITRCVVSQDTYMSGMKIYVKGIFMEGICENTE
jgi:hypothetical protein